MLAEPGEGNSASTAIASVVVETDTSEGGAASIATGVAVSETVQNSAAPIELEALAQSREEDDATTAVAALVVAETDSRESESAPIAPEITENEQLAEGPAKVEVFTKPELLTIAELQRYSVLCDELRERHGYPRGGGLAGWI